MKDFAELFHDLDNMTKTNDRLNRLIRFLLGSWRLRTVREPFGG